MKNNKTIVISSGKGGTGKTFVSTNLARVLELSGKDVRYLDCDVEEPNGHLFLHPEIESEKDATIFSPVGIDAEKCTGCGKCEDHCNYNAIAVIKKKALFFQDLCHICGACTLVCSENAIIESDRVIGTILQGKSNTIDFHYALLKTGEGGMSPRLIKKVKENIGQGINIIDSPPGTSCPVVETVKGSDLCVLVTDPTPFGLHDLKLSVDMCRETGIEPVVLINRAGEEFNDLNIYCKEEELEIIGEIPDDRVVAQYYSIGELAVEKIPQYLEIFQEIADKIIDRSMKPKLPLKRKIKKNEEIIENLIKVASKNEGTQRNTKEVVVISGKGGTGKTSLVAAFCALAENIAISDCDVDAADLHLVLKPEIKESGIFSGGSMAYIDAEKCTGCGKCISNCRFEAIDKIEKNNKIFYRIDTLSCEGCGVCAIVCPVEAITLKTSNNGQWFISETKFGPMSHAKLGVAEENSGKLVSLVRNKKNELAELYNIDQTIIDGSPGTGCPVIASITGTDYAVVVTEPTVSGIHDLHRVLDVINFFNVKAGIIVNKYDLNEDKTREIEKISDKSGADFLGKIPYDRSITHAQMKGISIIEFINNDTTDIIKEIWNKISSTLLPKEELALK